VQIRPAAMLVLARQLAVEGPTLVKSHHACCDVNGVHLWADQWTGRVVVPVRDPRDVACSLADHFGFSLQEAVEFMGKEDATIGGDDRPLFHVLGRWSEHVSSWLNTDRAETHIVRYEDLQEAPVESFSEILRFLQVPDVEREVVEEAVEACRFERMQEVEDKVGFPEKSEHQDRFFRKGEAGGWRDDLPADLSRRIEEEHCEVMERLGYL